MPLGIYQTEKSVITGFVKEYRLWNPGTAKSLCPEAEFSGVIETKVSLLFSHISTTNGFYLPTPIIEKWLKRICSVNIVYGYLKSENSQDYT